MGRHAPAAVEDFHHGTGVTRFHGLTRQLVGHAVVVPLDVDMVVDVGPDLLPAGKLVGLGRERLQGRPIEEALGEGLVTLENVEVRFRGTGGERPGEE